MATTPAPSPDLEIERAAQYLRPAGTEHLNVFPLVAVNSGWGPPALYDPHPCPGERSKHEVHGDRHPSPGDTW
jgi:hypothetical protein